MNDVKNKKLKKKMIIAIIIAVSLIPVFMGISYAIEMYNLKKIMVEPEPIDYDFYPVDYEENIYEDEEYLSLMEYGYIYYTDASVTLGIQRENANSYGDDIEFIVEYIYKIIEGKTEEYNGCFSDLYYKYHKRHERFTMQKLYDINLNKVSETTVTDKNGSYAEYKFELSYRILKNNGSFRSDIGDGSKKQYITVTDRDGKLLIDSLTTATTIVQK